MGTHTWKSAAPSETTGQGLLPSPSHRFHCLLIHSRAGSQNQDVFRLGADHRELKHEVTLGEGV